MSSSLRSREAVMIALRGARGGLTRAELVAATGLSRPTVGAVLDDLGGGSAPLVTHVRDQRVPGAAGPAPNRYRLTPPAGLYVGVDFGQRHVTIRVSDASGAPVGRPVPSLLTDKPLGFDALEEAARLVRRAIGRRLVGSDIKNVVMGVPAPVTAGGVIATGNYLPAWSGVAIGHQFGDQLQATLDLEVPPPVHVENDANLGVIGEATYGVARGYDDIIYIKVSTGVGCGILHGGTLWTGHDNLAGELGHVGISARARDLVDVIAPGLFDGRANCLSCGRPDCIQNLASTQSIVEIVRNPASPRKKAKYSAFSGFADVLKAAGERPRSFDRALHAISAAGAVLGSAIADLALVLDPAAIVLGGYLAGAGTLVSQPIEQALRTARLSHVAVQLVPVSRVPQSEVEGAVALALEGPLD